MTLAYLGIGSNLGDRWAHLERAVELLAELGSIVAVSSVYESEPVGPPGQDNYLNAVVALETPMSAAELLEGCLAVEKAEGRVRSVRWGPRTLDVDILLFGEEVIEEDWLKVPHPRMAERPFVTGPLLEIAPGVCDPAPPHVAGRAWKVGRLKGYERHP